ncbi:MAG: hypothetical protein V4501_07255 [Pseudomonadota bacterium]
MLNADSSSLAALHADKNNLGIAEKFLAGKIHGQEWLTDVDLERMATVCGIKENISITRLNPLDIGTILHFKRKKHVANTPYSISLLLNKGSSGDISSQGSHWVSAMLNVDPTTREINIVFRDSLHMSSIEQEKIKSELTKAINYQETVAGSPPKAYRAFPGFKLTFDMAEPNVAPLQHADSWSCGYQAFKNLVDQLPVVNNTHFNELRNLVDVTADKLRGIFYRALLGGIELSTAALKEAKIDSKIVVGGKINAEYLHDFVEHVAKMKPNRVPEKISPAELKELKEIEEAATEELKLLEEKFKEAIVSKSITLDLTEIFSPADTKVASRAKMIALARLIDKYEFPEVSIINIKALEGAENIKFFNQQFNLLKTKFNIDAAELEHTVSQELILINNRNELINILNVKIEKDENPWQDLWRQRISNGAIYKDQLSALETLNLYTSGNHDYNFTSAVNDSVEKIAPRYLEELLKYLNSNKDFFQNRDGGFHLKNLALSSYQRDADPDGKAALAQLETLNKWCEQEHYFPFTAIDLTLNQFTPEAFTVLKKFIEIVGSRYPSVNFLRLKLTDNELGRLAFTADQYDELIALYKKHDICLNIVTFETPSGADTTRQIAFENQVVDNIRTKNIKQLLGNKVEPSVIVTPIEVIDEASARKSRNIRPYKLQNFDIRQNLNTEINVDQQQELQQQHQLQTQLQQEVQQQIQIQEQSQAEIDDSSGDFQGEDLIDYEKYQANDYMSDLIIGFGKQKVTGHKGKDGDKEAVWQDVFGIKPFLPKTIKYVTQSAISKIHTVPQYFLYGINMDNLPEGFFVQQYQEKFVLCFDETKFVENKNQSPLTVKISSVPLDQAMLGDQRVFLPDDTGESVINKELEYRRWTLPDLNKLINGLLNKSGQDQAKFQLDYGWVLEDLTNTYINYFTPPNCTLSLVKILYTDGAQGLQVLLEALKQMKAKDEALYIHFKECFIHDRSNIKNVLTENNLKVMADLPNMSSVEKTWWLTMVSQQARMGSPMDLAQLYDAFQYFLKRLREANITLPFVCPIEDCNNMQVGLDRMLGILSKVNPRNLVDQLENMKGLSFHEAGAWYAGRWLNFHYFHPAMGLSPDKFNDQFEKNILQREELNLTYRIDFADLAKVALSPKVDNLDYPIILFHRYLGGAARINSTYQYYVELIASLREQQFPLAINTKLLALLAVATTGDRGCLPQDPIPLFSFIAEQDTPKIEEVLTAVIEEIDNWQDKPNLDELTSIVKLLATSTLDIKPTLTMLASQNSVATLESFTLWNQNTQHLAADHFISFFERLQNFDPVNIDYLAKIAASLQEPFVMARVDELITLLKQIKLQPTYAEIIKTLASIDTSKDKTDHTKLPALEDLNKALNAVVKKNDQREIFPLLAAQLPDCKFNLASNIVATQLDYASAMQKSLDDFNAILNDYNIPPLEDEDLQQDLAKNIQKKMFEIEQQAIKKNKMMWNIVKDTVVYEKVMAVAKEAILGSVNSATVQFPQLTILLKSKFPEPALANRYDSIGNNIVILTQYANSVNELFGSLLQLRNRWPDLTIDFLINSPRANQFTPTQLQRIMASVNLLEVSFIPASLLKSIFADNAFAALDDKPANVEQLTRYICQVIELKELNLTQRAKLIDIVTNAKDPSIIEDLIKMLKKIKDQHPPILNDCFNLLESYYKENTDKRVITAINGMAHMLGDNAEIKQIYFHGLRDHLAAFLEISETVLEDVAATRRADFTRILTYSCLEQESDAKALIENQDILNQLKELSGTPEFDELNKLYQKRPYPKLAKLKQFFEIDNAKDRQKFIDNYELDPPGLLAKPENVDKLFDMSGIDQRIDAIRDLSRDVKNPLFYTHRKKLMQQMVFVNSIGRTHNLSVPGISATFPAGKDKKAYQKPALKLTKQQLQNLIKHYRAMISNPKDYSAEEINLAKLEFVALARIAMYRTTGKLPYSTQVLSLLNVMLQGGNIYSEIRTGEGKGGITGLFAASKWMEGGAVDVLSSNMELAARDLEEFNDFYEYLGIGTHLIRAKTKADAYKQDGINYSDVSELALFQQQCDLFHHKLPDKVSCILDESDFTALDNTTQFRFATSLDESFDPHFNPNEWLYPIILEFVASKEFLNKENPLTTKQDIKALKQFVIKHTKLKNAEKTKFSKITDVQLDKWIDSAYTASQLVAGEDFVVRDTHIVREGQSIPVQVARVKILHRESSDSSFSNGVHQFLHTRLNLEIDAKERSGKKFPIEPEKTYLASKSAKNFIDYYMRRGNVLGLTGTVGSENEIMEMRKNYGFKFYKIPPHKPLVRKDHAPIFARRQRKGWFWLQKETAQEAHLRTILEQAKEFRRKGQPELAFCDGVKSSQTLYDYLLQKLGPNKLQLFNGEQLNVREKDLTDSAGLSEEITVTTPMLGRGNDFKPHYENGDPVLEGLAVIDTFISPDRDYGQKIGRAGRNNARGDTVLVVSEDEFKKYGMPVPRNQADLELAIEKIKALLNNENFKQRRERQLFADVKDQFFNQYVFNCRNLKANVENFYQHLGAKGASETWQPLQHLCHLLWEQFLNKIDSRWNELVVELHNDLGKLPVAEKDALEKKWLQEKTLVLTEFANKEWALTLTAIELTSNEKLSSDYAAASKRIEESRKQPLDAEVAALVIPDVKLATYQAQAFTSPPVPIYEEVPVNLTYNSLDATQVNADEVYLSLTDSKEPDVKANAFFNELNIIYSKLFKNGPQASGFGLVTIAQVSLRKLLNDYHNNYKMHTEGQNQTSTLALYFRLMESISKYGDEQFKRAAYDIYTDHVHTYGNDGNYVHLMANNMFTMRNAGALPADAAIDSQELLGMSEEQVWEELRAYAENKLEGYAWSLFKSDDRSKALASLKLQLTKIDESHDTPSQKIASLIEKVNEASIAAAASDLHQDRQKGSWSIFSYRNTDGSRFQNILTKITDKAMSFAQVMPESNLKNEESIAYFAKILGQLLERTDLIKVRNHDIISQLRADHDFRDAIFRLETNANKLDSQKDLLFIYQRLHVYLKKFNDSKERNNSINAYTNFMTEVLGRLEKFQFAQETKELASGPAKDNFYSSNTFILRKNIQSAIEALLQKDHIAKKNINLTKYANILPGNGVEVRLAPSVLFEIERCLKLQFPQVKSIDLVKSKTSYAKDRLTAGFILTFKNNEVFNVPIVVNSFSKAQGKNDFVFVEWPEIKAESVAPVKSKRISRSAAVAPYTPPSVSPKNIRKKS